MNTLLNPTQSDTKAGDIVLLAKDVLTGLEAYLTKIVSDGGIAKASLPTSQKDIALFLVASGGAVGAEVSIEAPSNSNFRVKAKGAGSAGCVLVPPASQKIRS